MEMASERKRDGGIEAPSWWVQMAKAERVRTGKRVEDVAADVSALLQAPVDQSRISKCLNGTTSTIPLMEAISIVIGVPTPVFVAADASEARELAGVQAGARRRAEMLARADQKRAQDREVAEELADRQTRRVESKDGGKAGRVVGGVGRGRGVAGKS